jgi:hypothetical protein
MNGVSPFHPKLPAHHFGVHVENDMDARRLLCLIEQVGVAKVERSAAKYSAKYSGSMIFVSALLKLYRVRVPSRIYAPLNVPLYRVYLLLHPASSKLKLGCSGDWTNRAARFNCDFDLDRSVGISFGGDKASALAAERMAKKRFQFARTDPPPSVPFGAYGHKEWFEAVIFENALAEISNLDSAQMRNCLSLRMAIAHDLRCDEVSISPHILM